MKKRVFFLTVYATATLGLLFTSCSKKEDALQENNVEIPSFNSEKYEFEIPKDQPNQIEVLLPKELTSLKSTSSIYRREGYSSTGTLTTVDYMYNYHNRLEFVYKYDGSNNFLGGYQVSYMADGRVSTKRYYDYQGYFKKYVVYYYLVSDGSLCCLSMYNIANELLEYHIVQFTNGRLWRMLIYSKSGSGGFFCSDEIHFNWDGDQLSSLDFSGANPRYFYYSGGQTYAQEQYYPGHTRLDYYFRFDGYFQDDAYEDGVYGGSFIYYLDNSTPSNYDPFDPTNIFNLEFYNPVY